MTTSTSESPVSTDQMAPKTLEALKGSIAKWEAIVAGTGEDLGWQNCPLCTLFYNNRCDGCPVALRTNEVECELSPYEAWQSLAWKKYSSDKSAKWIVSDEESRAAAQAELDFLKSLLPKEGV